MTDRDHFAAAALTGFASQPRFNCGSVLTLTAKQCYELADAMLRERERTNHDAAPAARASVESVAPQPTTRGDSDRTDKAAPRPSEGTGDTPATHATHGDGSEQRECTEPVAWAVMPSNSDYCVTLSTRKEAAKKAAERKVEVGEYATMDDIVIVPLYRHPPCQDLSRKNLTLTDAEREAVERGYCSLMGVEDMSAECTRWDAEAAAVLRGLLERLRGVE